MASINASTSGAGGVITTADATGNLNIQSAGSTVLALTSSGTTVTGTGSFSGNLSFNSGYGSVAVAYGCRAWVNVSNPSSSTIAGSGNVTSITRSSVGNFSVNFTNAMPDANYAVVTGFQNSAWGQALIYDVRSTTGVTLQCGVTSGNQDPTQFSVAIFR